MKVFRTLLFWAHLVTGVLAAAVILLMSVTGVALTYEKQMLEWADARRSPVPFPVDAPRLPPETLLATLRDTQPGTAPATVILRRDPDAPVTVQFEGGKTLLVNPYTAAVIGEPSPGLRAFFRSMTNWHRWLALEGASRSTGRAVTGAANLAFLVIVVSGLYIWVPKVWRAAQFKPVLWFRRGLPGKARDFNWHNVIGFWSAVPLAIVVAGAVPISYPWASNLVYRLVGDTPPAPARAPAAGASGERREPSRDVNLAGMDAAWARAQEVPAWRTISLRLAGPPQAPLTLTIDEGYGGQPQKRGTLTVDRATGQVVKWETFGDLSRGRQWRSWLRFAHTGEVYGLAGQTVAGLVSAGGVVLVYTGLALAWRRLRAWVGRRADHVERARKAA